MLLLLLLFALLLLALEFSAVLVVGPGYKYELLSVVQNQPFVVLNHKGRIPGSLHRI